MVLDPEEFCENREEIILGLSDRMPFWIGFGGMKQLYFEDEAKKKGTKGVQKTGETFQKSRRLELEVTDEGLSQLRGLSETGNDKVRITVEASPVG